MSHIILKMTLSQDGFCSGPQGDIRWIFQYTDKAVTSWEMKTIGQAGLFIMGKHSFHDMCSYWPYSREPFAEPMNKIPKAVFSRSGRNVFDLPRMARALTKALSQNSKKDAARLAYEKKETSWREAEIFSGDLRRGILQLKKRPGKDVIAFGGATFAQNLVGQNLVDEYQLLIHPVLLGNGLPIFSKLPKPQHLKLVNLVKFPAGSVAHIYRPK